MTLCTLCLTDVAHYNFNTRQPSLLIFGRHFAERVHYLIMIVIPPLLTTWCNMNPGNWVSSVMLHTKNDTAFAV